MWTQPFLSRTAAPERRAPGPLCDAEVPWPWPALRPRLRQLESLDRRIDSGRFTRCVRGRSRFDERGRISPVAPGA
jgi:hypothetical protein